MDDALPVNETGLELEPLWPPLGVAIFLAERQKEGLSNE